MFNAKISQKQPQELFGAHKGLLELILTNFNVQEIVELLGHRLAWIRYWLSFLRLEFLSTHQRTRNVTAELIDAEIKSYKNCLELILTDSSAQVIFESLGHKRSQIILKMSHS